MTEELEGPFLVVRSVTAAIGIAHGPDFSVPGLTLELECISSDGQQEGYMALYLAPAMIREVSERIEWGIREIAKGLN